MAIGWAPSPHHSYAYGIALIRALPGALNRFVLPVTSPRFVLLRTKNVSTTTGSSAKLNWISYLLHSWITKFEFFPVDLDLMFRKLLSTLYPSSTETRSIPL